MNEAMGGREYENKLAEYWRCENLDHLLEKSRENFEANAFTEQEMRKVLPAIFGFC